ncbi:MAG: DUF433 domain-containing protein [Acidobacteriia bacterium]|nr:DUF433 domain-containing protein [Terriglobia bacterium]
MQEVITRDPEVMHGTPVFRGTRVPVQTLFDYIEHGDSLDEFLEGFPTISRELAVQVAGGMQGTSSRASLTRTSRILTADGFRSSFCVPPPTALRT